MSDIERAFFYMPLEHAEDTQIQQLSIEKFEELVEQAEPVCKPLCESFLDYAIRHKVIIDRFGHYPHRNHALNRPTTPEEEAFLQEEGSSF